MKLLEHFDSLEQPITYYAHFINYVERDSCIGKCALLFEAVMKDKVEMFVSGTLSPKLSEMVAPSRYFSEAWESFGNGMDSEVFLDKKFIYLAEASSADISVMLGSFAEAKRIENAENDWWEITIYPSDSPGRKGTDFCMISLPFHAPIEEEFPFEIRPVSKEVENALYHLYTVCGSDRRAEGIDERPDGNLVGTIQNNTAFSGIDVYYVGAALACALFDDHDRCVAFFDMGKENPFSTVVLERRNPVNAQVMVNVMNASCQQICNEVSVNPLTIIISHWHKDHVSILKELADHYVNRTNQRYDNFWRSVNIICPQIIGARGWAVMEYAAITGAMDKAGRDLGDNQYRINHMLEQAYVNANGTVPINVNNNSISIGKCDRNDAGNRAINHHDHAIAAVVTLTNGSEVFLAGDSAYDTLGVGNKNAPVLTNNGAGYTYLVASHHGGKYSHTQAVGKNEFIPRPSTNVASPKKCVFSANGVAYGHPVPANVLEYQHAGWVTASTHQINFNLYNSISLP